jgi:NADPH-dependent 2,4-dienoyl-CoA reductase/sulfur reductase-like enzyme
LIGVTITYFNRYCIKSRPARFSPGEIAAPLRSVLSRQKNTRVLLGQVVDIDPQSKRVLLADGASFEYDSLMASEKSGRVAGVGGCREDRAHALDARRALIGGAV